MVAPGELIIAGPWIMLDGLVLHFARATHHHRLATAD